MQNFLIINFDFLHIPSVGDSFVETIRITHWLMFNNPKIDSVKSGEFSHSLNIIIIYHIMFNNIII